MIELELIELLLFINMALLKWDTLYKTGHILLILNKIKLICFLYTYFNPEVFEVFWDKGINMISLYVTY